MVKDILKDKDYMFITRHYWKLLFTYIGVLYVIDPMLGIFAFSFPACVYFAKRLVLYHILNILVMLLLRLEKIVLLLIVH